MKWAVLLPLIFFVLSCASESKKETNSAYLGFPHSSTIQARFIPSKWAYLATQIDENSNTSSDSTPAPTSLGWFESIASEYPTFKKLLENYNQLEPDLSTNWVASASESNGARSASLYLRFNGQKFLSEFTKTNKTTTSSLIGNRRYITMDPEAPGQLAMVTQEKHMLLIHTTSDHQEDLEALIQASFYPQKSTFIKHFKNKFKNSEQLISVHLQIPEDTKAYIQNQKIQELLNGQKITLGLDFNPSTVELDLQLDSSNIVSRLFKATTVDAQQENGVALHLNLELLMTQLTELGLRNNLEHELKKVNMSSSELIEAFTGEVNVNYLGKTQQRDKSISYEFDDNFNEVEKISYRTLESHNIGGAIGIKSIDKAQKLMDNLGIFSKTGTRTYTPISLSNSPIEIQPDRIQIGTHQLVRNSDSKLFIQTDHIKTISPKNELLELNPFESLTLELNKDNLLTLKLSGEMDHYEYLKTVKNLIAPSL